MSQLIVFKGSNNTTFDLTRYIPMGKYKVNDFDVVGEEFEDSNYNTHKRIVRQRAEGAFTVVFPNISTYEAFDTFIAANTTNGYIACDLYVMKGNKVKSTNVFIEYDPQNDLPYLAEKKSQGFEISIIER